MDASSLYAPRGSLVSRLVKRGLAESPTLALLARHLYQEGLAGLGDLARLGSVIAAHRAADDARGITLLHAWLDEAEDVPLHLSELAYMVHAAALREHGKQAIAVEFERHGIRQGVLPADLLDRLIGLVAAARSGHRPADDFHPAYHHTVEPPETEPGTGDHRFVFFSPGQRAELSEIFATLAAPIETCFGSPGRVVNLKSWWTPPSVPTVGMNEWHMDGMPPEICKLMVYPRGASPELGTTEFIYRDGSRRTIEGPPGTYTIIKNSAFYHRGIAPTRDDRILIELTLAPAAETDWRMANGGSVATYPKLPWAELPH